MMQILDENIIANEVASEGRKSENELIVFKVDLRFEIQLRVSGRGHVQNEFYTLVEKMDYNIR